MAIRVTKKEKKAASIKKINKVFERMMKEGHSVKAVVQGNEKKNSNNTLKQYSGDMVRYMDYLEEKFGIVDITEAKHEHFMPFVEKEVENWRNGDLAASHRIKSMRSALESFRVGSIKTDVFKKEIEIVNKKEVKEVLDYNHMRRMSDATSTISLGMDEGQKILDHIIGNEELGIKGSRSRHAEVAYHSFKIATLTGGRIADILDKLTLQDLKITEEELVFRNSKGNLTAPVPIEDETAQYIIKLAEKRSAKEPLLQLRNEKGKVMKKGNAIRTVERIVANAGEKSGFNKKVEVGYKYRDDKGKTRFGVTEVQQKVSFHTGRKIFVNSRFQKYVEMEEKTLKNQLNKRILNKDIKDKYQKALKRINENRTSGQRSMHHHEIAIFLTSLDSRHFRNDVITMWYLNNALVDSYRNK
jgi:hypothetical protein